MGESINTRIKKLRKEMQLNQTEFGQKIGLKNSAISKMEQEGSVVVDQNVQLICEKFHVRRSWLLEGEGEMFATHTKQDELMAWAARVSEGPHDDFPYRLADTLARMDEPQWQLLEQIFDSIMAGKDILPASKKAVDRRTDLHRQLDDAVDAEEEAAAASSSTASNTTSLSHKK